MLTSAHEGGPTTVLVNRRHPNLAIFELSAPTGASSLFYSAGHVAVLGGEDVPRVREALQTGQPNQEPRLRGVVESLETAALAEEAARGAWARAPFCPTSLVIDFRSQADPAFDDRLRAASRHVARACRRAGRPFRVVLRAGRLSTAALERTFRVASECASEARAAWTACAVLDEWPNAEQAQGIADACDEIDVWCGDAADVRSSAPRVLGEKLARARRSLFITLKARRFGLGELVDLAALAGELGAEARVDTSGGFQPTDAPAFTASFLEADRRAQASGVALRLSSLCIGEELGGLVEDQVVLAADGPPRPRLRHPNGQACVQDGLPPFDLVSGELSTHAAPIAETKARLSEVAAGCRLCFNAYHCVSYEIGGSSEEGHATPASFECSVRRAVAQHVVLEATRDLRPSVRRREPPGVSSQARPRLGEARVVEALADVPSAIEVDPILEQWGAVSDWFEEERRALPEPVWTRHGFEDDGEEAWRVLRALGPTLPSGPLSVYVHVPFCRRRCGFCDCYSEPLRGASEATFLSAVRRDLAAWSDVTGLSQRAVTTIHFGGGTPGDLDPSSLKSLVEGCRSHLGVHAATEWAIESTASLLTDRHLDLLWSLGFRRLHVGVQTLDDDLRALLGRREHAPQVVHRIRKALELGFVVSVDLLYGVPGQKLARLLQDVGSLTQAGVHGFSLYQLQDSNRNRAFLGRRGWLTRDSFQAYLAFQICEQALRRQGYDKNHFTHLARPEDGNLYYTHPSRGEDLLGLGPSADGTLGGYRYRHAWIEARGPVHERAPALEGGRWDSDLERRTRPLASALMGGRVESRLFEGGTDGILQEWVGRRLLQPAGRGAWSLTANGSWFLTRMLAQVENTVGARVAPAPDS